MRTRVKIAFAIWGAAMIGLSFAAEGFVKTFGAGSGFALILAMYVAARYFERRA